MCTLTWKQSKTDYIVRFNRDELRSRETSSSPKKFKIGNTSYLAPIDPQSTGTWISANTNGVTLCLMNRYGYSPDNPKSRGYIIPSLSKAASISEAFRLIKNLDLTSTPSFSLFCISLVDSPKLMHWNGVSLLCDDTPYDCLSSSSFSPDTVIPNRIGCFDRFKEKDLLEFHASHLPSAGPYSVCVHRHNVATVSYSEILATTSDISFSYHDGSPCAKVPPIIETLVL